MEVIPFLEPGDKAALGLWYIISSDQEAPCPRVGHACLTLQSHTCKRSGGPSQGADGEEARFDGEKVIIVAGATPSGPFGDVYILELSKKSFIWTKLETEQLLPRYEHGIMEDKHSNLYVFGGAQQETNLNDVQMLKKGEKTWVSCKPKGNAPCPRTCLNVGQLGEKMYVFGGGLQGAEPVDDDKIHVFNADECSWEQLETTGTGPTPRLGHLILTYDRKIFIHGGMSGHNIYDDMFILDTDSMRWDKVSQKGQIPAARTAHAGVVQSSSIYIFGGMNLCGALNDLHQFDIGNSSWSKVEIQGEHPPPRLDHTLCCVEVHYNDTEEKVHERKQTLLLSFGGMDTQGGLVCRGIIERVPDHNIHTFITLSAPLMGQFGVPPSWTKLFPFLNNKTRDELTKIMYHTFTQDVLSVANYWRDPRPEHFKTYEKVCKFLPLLENNPEAANYVKNVAAAQKKNFLKVAQMVAIGGPDDGVIDPWYSSIYGYLAPDCKSPVPMLKQKAYTEDWFGLRSLDERGNLAVYEFSGVKHKLWHSNKTVFDNAIKKWLV